MLEETGRAGRCWCSVPPNATFITCIPRQMQSVGVAARWLLEQRPISKASRSGLDAVVVRQVGVGAVPSGVDVAAPDQDGPSKGSRISAGSPCSPGEHDGRSATGSPDRVDMQRGDAVAAVGPPSDRSLARWYATTAISGR